MKKSAAVLLMTTAVAACAPYDKGVGGVRDWNVAQQVVNPDPVYPPEADQPASGERSAAAVRRLENGAVIQPVGSTTTVKSGGSGSSPR